MTTQIFTGVIEKLGAKTMILLPFDPNQVWGAKQRHHIRGSVAGHTIRGPLGSEGNRYYLPLGEAWMRGTGLESGVTVKVELFPEGPQSETIGQDIAAALDAEPEAKAFFESLATFYRNNYIKWVEGAKRPETRSARLAEMIVLLKSRKKQR